MRFVPYIRLKFCMNLLQISRNSILQKKLFILGSFSITSINRKLITRLVQFSGDFEFWRHRTKLKNCRMMLSLKKMPILSTVLIIFMLNFDVIYCCSGGGSTETTTQVPGAKTTESSGDSNETETNAPLANTTMHSNGT